MKLLRYKPSFWKSPKEPPDLYKLQLARQCFFTSMRWHWFFHKEGNSKSDWIKYPRYNKVQLIFQELIIQFELFIANIETKIFNKNI